ncbi:MAG: DNA repair protein RecN [Thermomicrobiales bacterium]|nr:MAG: DNA repair protein RecN [Thermomicrobiales bacterium]
MLLDLEIRDFAIIDDLSIQFGPGVNALTGETGAGKSIIIDALGAVLGERVSADMVRSGAKTAYVDARFLLDGTSLSPSLRTVLEEHGVGIEDDELILSREIQSGGRSSARVNGRSATAALLGQIGALLVDIHGQSDHLSLLQPAAQLAILDRYAQLDSERSVVAALVRDWRAAQAHLVAIDRGARDRAQRVDLLRFQVDEIELAGLLPGEETELETERSRLTNAERLGQLVGGAASLVGGDEMDGASAADGLRNAMRSLADAAALDSSLTGLSERLTDAALLVDELALDLRDYLDQVEANPDRLANVQERLETIKQLKRKYGATVEDILEHRDLAARELEALGGSEHDESALRARVDQLEAAVREAAATLTQNRVAAAKRLAMDASTAAADLNLGSMMFDIAVRPKSGPTLFDETGADHVEFMFSPNRGEAPKSLSRTASGGETARMMLALKSVLADSDHTPTLVFDEVDVGIGGRSGQMVGLKLQQLGNAHQVIVITHLPQIAAVAEHHFKIKKSAFDGRTTSRVILLEGDERVDEIASMIDGEPPSATSRKGAREMLERTGITA